MRRAILDRVRAANVQLQAALGSAREALAGRRNFGPEELRAAAKPVAEVDALVGEAATLRQKFPELDQELNAYARSLAQMQEALDGVRCVLLARCAALETERGHLEAVGLWATAWRQTQPGDQR